MSFHGVPKNLAQLYRKRKKNVVRSPEQEEEEELQDTGVERVSFLNDEQYNELFSSDFA